MIPLNKPWITDLEKKYVLDALDSGWTTTGEYVRRFEAAFADWAGRKYAITCSSGTTALWLAVKAVEAGPVAIPAYTCDAVGNAVIQAGQVPVILDVEPESWGLSADELTQHAGKIRMAVLVHTYGVPARDTVEIVAFCRAQGIALIEDCSEAHGAQIGGQMVGRFGDIAVWSCRGEKILGAGQMGVVATDSPALAARVRWFANNGLPSGILRYWSTTAGLNLMTSNLLAALGLAQLERIDALVLARRHVHAWWQEILGNRFGGNLRFQRCPTGSDSAAWLTAIDIDPNFTRLDARDIGAGLWDLGVETRPGFYPLNWMPHLTQYAPSECAVSAGLFRRLLILPSGPEITLTEQCYTSHALAWLMGRSAYPPVMPE